MEECIAWVCQHQLSFLLKIRIKVLYFFFTVSFYQLLDVMLQRSAYIYTLTDPAQP